MKEEKTFRLVIRVIIKVAIALILLKNKIKQKNFFIILAQKFVIFSRKKKINSKNLPNFLCSEIYLKVNVKDLKFCTPKGKTWHTIFSFYDNVDSLAKRQFINDPTYLALKGIINHGRSWYELPFFRNAKELHRANRNIVSAITLTLAIIRLKKLKRLYKNMKDNKPLLTNRTLQRIPGVDEIGVDLGKIGIYLNRGGTHRLAIAKLLGHQSVPAVICRIDRKLIHRKSIK